MKRGGYEKLTKNSTLDSASKLKTCAIHKNNNTRLLAQVCGFTKQQILANELYHHSRCYSDHIKDYESIKTMHNSIF